MRWLIFIILLYLSLLTAAQAQTIIYADDFEGTVSGWSVNTTQFDSDTTRFLGRFDNSPNATQQSFTVPPSTDRVEITFDFYRFDSWDNTAQWGFDRFEIDINGTEIFSLPFAASQDARSGTTGSVQWSHVPLGPTSEFAFGTGEFWFDQKHRFTIIVTTPGTILDLTLRTDLNQGGNDESGGFDNMLIEAFPKPANILITKDVDTVTTPGLEAYNLPGSDVLYTFALTSTGGALDSDSIILTDVVPSDLSVFTGDFDGSGNPFIFEDNSMPPSELNCCSAGQYEFSNTTSGAPVFGYVPSTPYDPAVTYLRILPSGTLRDATNDPVNLEFKFRARIK